MPCTTDPRFDHPSHSAAAELDKVTSLLCAVLNYHAPVVQNSMFRVIPGLQTWWQHHQLLDAQRLERERQLALLNKKQEVMARASREAGEKFDRENS